MFFSNIGNCRFNVHYMKYNPIFLLTSETTHFIERVVNRKKSSALDLSETHMLYYRRFVTADKNEPLQVLSVWDGMKRERFNLDSEMIPNAVDVRARCVSTTHFSVARAGRRACELSSDRSAGSFDFFSWQYSLSLLGKTTLLRQQKQKVHVGSFPTERKVR